MNFEWNITIFLPNPAHEKKNYDEEKHTGTKNLFWIDKFTKWEVTPDCVKLCATKKFLPFELLPYYLSPLEHLLKP